MRAPRPISPIPARFVFSSLFPELRATKRPTTPLTIGCIALLSTPIRPQFLSLRPRNLAHPPLRLCVCVCVCRTTFDEPPRLRLHRCLLARLSSSMLYGFSFFFFFSSFFQIYRVVYLDIRFWISS